MPSDTVGKVSETLVCLRIHCQFTYVTLSRPLPVKFVKPSLHHTGDEVIGNEQAAVAWEAGKDLAIEEIEVGPPKAHEVRIEIYYTGVCHTGLLRSLLRREC